MPLFIHKTIKVELRERIISVLVTQVLIPATMEYRNMVKVEGKLIPLKAYLGDQTHD